MPTTREFNVRLPHDVADMIDAKIRSGAYASASDVMGDGLRALMERDAAVDRWLREDVIAGHEEYLADPSKAVPAEEILDRIKARRAARRQP